MNRNARLRRSQSCTTPSATADTNEAVDGGYDRFGTLRPKSSDSGEKEGLHGSRLLDD